jgi:hypothetical protein
LEFDAVANEIRLNNPCLPAFLEDVTLRNVRLGTSSVDLAVHRRGEFVSVEVLRQRGSVRVALERREAED